MRLNIDEVDAINECTQIYASKLLFYREDKPDILDAFEISGYRQLLYSGHDLIDDMLDHLSQFNLWGEGGNPSISGKRPYTTSLRENREFERFVKKARSDDE